MWNIHLMMLLRPCLSTNEIILRIISNQHQHQKHQQDHANVNCSVCNKSFSAKRNLKRHMKTVHKAVEMDVSRNSNNSNPDNNLNEQDEIINNATFLMDPLLWLAFNLPTFMDYLYRISTIIMINWHFDIMAFVNISERMTPQIDPWNFSRAYVISWERMWNV